MFKPIRLAAVLLICAVLLPVAGSPSFSASADLLAGIAPPLGAAESFGVLAGSTLTNTGPTVINGDAGVSPGLAVTGFPPGVVVPPGAIHVGDAVAAQAQSAVTVAYNALAGQACDFNLTGQDLGGLTLTPGVYCFDTSAQLTGQLTLNVQGDSNAVFVFKMGSTLTTASSSSVVFSNGGPSCNVFWQVGSSATFGTAGAFAGNVIALTSATLTTGVSVIGKVLARNGAVTLDTNTILPCVAAQSATVTPTGTSTSTATATATMTATATPISTPTATPTGTVSPIATATPTGMPTMTATATPISTPTATPTGTVFPIATATPTGTPAPTPTVTNTPPPSAVELLYFVVSRQGSTVMLDWATAAEVDNYGFNLYRAPANDFAQATWIHFEPSAIQGAGAGATYAYLDTPPGHGAWWYWLADIDTHGIQTRNTPSVTITMRLQVQIYLPLVVTH